MNRRAATAVLALALMLLLATQVWVDAVVEAAPGAPRTRVAVTGGDASSWGLAAALLGTIAAVLASVRRSTWSGVLLLLACGAALAAAVAVVVRPVAAVGVGPGEVVSAAATGWAWAAVGATLLATLAAATSLAPAPDRVRQAGTAPPAPAERERRSVAELWRALSEGRDPTGGA